jgi:hypothetical protein
LDRLSDYLELTGQAVVTGGRSPSGDITVVLGRLPGAAPTEQALAAAKAILDDFERVLAEREGRAFRGQPADYKAPAPPKPAAVPVQLGLSIDGKGAGR